MGCGRGEETEPKTRAPVGLRQFDRDDHRNKCFLTQNMFFIAIIFLVGLNLFLQNISSFSAILFISVSMATTKSACYRAIISLSNGPSVRLSENVWVTVINVNKRLKNEH